MRAPRCFADLRRFLVPPDDDVRKGFVVPERHVIARLEALDEIGFKQKRLGFGARVHELHGRCRADHRRDPVRMAPHPRIVLNAVLEVSRLADVNDLARLIHHAIDAGTRAQVLDVARNDLRPRFGRGFNAVRSQIAGADFDWVLDFGHERYVTRISGVCHKRCWPPSSAIICPVMAGEPRMNETAFAISSGVVPWPRSVERPSCSKSSAL